MACVGDSTQRHKDNMGGAAALWSAAACRAPIVYSFLGTKTYTPYGVTALSPGPQPWEQHVERIAPRFGVPASLDQTQFYCHKYRSSYSTSWS